MSTPRIPVWKNKLSPLREGADAAVEQLRQHWFFEILQLCAVLMAVYWWPWRRLPVPGYAIGVLALLAAIMSLHTEMGRWHKVVWILLVGAYLVIEFRAIKKDRTEYATLEESRRAEQNNQFNDIAENLKKSMQQSHIQFSETTAGINRTLSTITGGDTVCYVIASPIGSEFLLVLATRGANPLHGVSTEMVDQDAMISMFRNNPKGVSFETIQSQTTYFPMQLFTEPSTSRTIGKITIGAGEARNLHFNFFSMNGMWGENLKLRKVNGAWIQALRVTKEIKGTGGKQKTVFEMVPKEYPRVNGKMDW
jgi:hypothetical protein